MEETTFLLGKFIVEMDIHCVTALHIGGLSEGIDIGGPDKYVLKDPMTELPYVSGSTMKGKSRFELELLPLHSEDKSCVAAQWEKKKAEWEGEIRQGQQGQQGEPAAEELNKLKDAVGACENPDCRIARMFGVAAGKGGGPLRAIFRDAGPGVGQRERWESVLGKGSYTEIKPENTVSRLTAVANPRQIERVPAGSEFREEVILNIYQREDVIFVRTLFQGLGILEDSTLGGLGSRGPGRVRFEQFRIVWRSARYYLDPNEGEKVVCIPSACQESAQEFLKHFNLDELEAGRMDCIEGEEDVKSGYQWL